VALSRLTNKIETKSMRLRRILSLHLSSSGFFALGTAIPVISYAIAYTKGSTVSDGLVEMFAWTFLCCHVLPEIIVDLNTFPKAKRKLHHMRYGRGPCTNFVQSMVFATCCIFQGIYFAHTWSEKDYDENNEAELEAYELLNLIAGHMWLLSGLISLCAIGSNCCPCRAADEHAGFWEKLANDLYVVTTLGLCVTGYIIIWNRSVGHVLHVVLRGSLCLLGAFYFIWDLMEEYAYRTRDGVSSDESRRRHKERLVDEGTDKA